MRPLSVTNLLKLQTTMSQIHKSGKRYGHGQRKMGERHIGTDYIDNEGHVYMYQWVARMASFFNIFSGCLRNGFPVYLPALWYEAWAFWPFFFFKKKLNVKDPVPMLNHERIHCRQQWDIHLTISLPFVIFVGVMEYLGHTEWLWSLIGVPFIPTFLYGISMLRAFFELKINKREVTFQAMREETCFERESNMHQMNWMYLGQRKFWGVLAYTCIPLFKKYL